MAKRSRTEITRSLALTSWLYWQVLRRQTGYADAVSLLKDQWADDAETSEDPLKRLSAEKTLSAMKSLEKYQWTADRLRDEIAVSMMIDDGLRPSGSPVIPDDFIKKWSIRFPVPPKIPELPSGELLTSPWCVPVRLLRGDKKEIVVDVFPQTGIEIVSAHLRGVLLHFLSKRKFSPKGKAQVISRKPGAKLIFQAETIADDGLHLTVKLPVDLEAIVQAVRMEFTNRSMKKSEATWRSREYYTQMLAAVDNRPQGRSGKSERIGGRSREDWLDTFNRITGIFGFSQRAE